ncbi:MAG: hypothetical protein QOF02_490 [Blastocatellia bacterium]|jgi:hypothetical protein|nr:hypothetical protein [Blastocatellia bacterium]
MTTKLYDSIVAQPNRAAELISQLDSADLSSRKAALETIRLLFDTFVTPAESLLSKSADNPAHLYFDPQQIAGSDFSGLTSGLLARQFPSLQQPPDDAALSAELDELGVEIDTAERRSDFFRAWMAERATLLTRLLLPVLEQNYAGDPAANAAELSSLRELSRQPLPGMERYLIQSLIESRSAGS